MFLVNALNSTTSQPLPVGLAAWVAERVGVCDPITVTPLSGGNSNETMMLSAGGERWILRHPPATTISRTANDLGREFRVLSALAQAEVPTPLPLGFIDDPEVAPVPCLLLEHRPGAPLRDSWPLGWRTDATAVTELGRAAVGGLASLHSVDWQTIGLEDFGRPDGYLLRQVSRWRSQYEQNQVRELPLFDQVADWLDGNRPTETSPAILHGDFHLDNCLFAQGESVELSAIIDWELSSIGDPLVDLGLLLAFWGPDRPETPAIPSIQAVSRISGAPSRRELADLYTELSGRSTEALPYYMTLAFFKLAAIVEGAYARYVTGHVDSDYARALADDVPLLLREAAHFTEMS